jgi:hypothetical protein
MVTDDDVVLGKNEINIENVAELDKDHDALPV